MPEELNEGEVKIIEKPAATTILIASAISAALGLLGGTQINQTDIDKIVSDAKVITLEEKIITIPERTEIIDVLNDDGKKVRIDTVITPAYDIAPIPTRDVWLDSTVKSGDKITVAIQHERDGRLIYNGAIRSEPTEPTVEGKIRVKIMNVR